MLDGLFDAVNDWYDVKGGYPAIMVSPTFYETYYQELSALMNDMPVQVNLNIDNWKLKNLAKGLQIDK